MPRVLTTIDALWHCLCPSFSPVWLTRPYLCSKPVKQAFRRCLKASQQRNYALACIPKGGRPQMPPRAYVHRTSKKQSFVSASGDPHELSGRGQLQDLPTEAAYEELRRAGNTGNYLRVQALAKILVRDRGEKPNPRLYLALLLANTNPQHGSPAEVKGLLQEMRDEGFTPDSSAYHAALKVG